jgi:hypothetical protein
MPAAGRHTLRLLPLLISAACAACESSSPTAPTAVLSNSLESVSASSFAGTWVGTLTTGFTGSGTATVVLNGPRADASYTGTWSVVFGDASQDRAGSLTTAAPERRTAPGVEIFWISAALLPVRIDGCSALPLPLASFVPDYRFDLTLVGRDRLSGQSLFAECYQLLPGRVELTRRVSRPSH